MFVRIPFFRIALFYILGILIATFFKIEISLLNLLLLFLLFFISHFITHKRIRFQYLFSIFLFVFLIASGIYFTNKLQDKAKINEIAEESFVMARISKEPVVKENTIQTNLAIEAIREKNNWRKTTGNVLLILEKDSAAYRLQKGDYIQFEPDFKEISSNKNPETFDYKQYLFFHLISKQSYLKSNKWKRISNKKSTALSDKIAAIRKDLLQRYKQYHIQGNELAVLSALTLGYKNELDSEIKNAYTHTGAIHVLAVSGLHVGIVYFIINYFLRFLSKSRTSRFLRLIITFLGIWFFAFLTGAAASVLRASLMFSIIAIGVSLKRSSSIYNSIFASAFLLLLWNPFLLFDLGFQLSYAALISIIYFQPLIAKCFTFKYKIFQWAWEVSAVSLAAQIGTLPITLYYFHQFPLYFWLSSWIVIPTATIIIWLAFIFFIFSGIPLIANVFAYTLSQIIHFQNLAIQEIEQWPYAWIKDISIDKWQVLLLITSILLLMKFTYKFTSKNLWYFLSFALLFFIYTDAKVFLQLNQNQIVIYDINRESAINFIYGKENILLSSLNDNEKKIKFNIKNHWLSMGLEQERMLSIKQLDQTYFLTNILKARSTVYFSKNNFVQFKNNRLLILHKRNQLQKLKAQKINLDFIVISNNFKTPLDTLNKYFSYNKIIVDASNSKRNELFWKQQASDDIYIISEKGAFVNNLEKPLIN